MRFALALALLVACGDGGKPTVMPDGSTETPDGMPDGMEPPEQLTFTKYVLDMIATQTTASATPRPYAEFSSLIDPDAASNNLAAYASLF